MAIQFRRATAARWAEVNPVLLEGQPGFEVDTNTLKIGDGVKPWSQLDSIGGNVSEDQIEAIVAEYLENHYANLNVVGPGQFVILEHDADASSVPDGTFIARLPSDWTP